jgi:exopolysaccharide production protein ExoQ
VRSQKTAPLSSLVISWASKPVLIFLTLGGVVRVDTQSANTEFSAAYTSMANSHDETVIRIAYCFVLAAAILCLRYIKSVLAGARRQTALSLLVLLAMVSCAWSQMPMRSLQFSAFLLVNFSFALAISHRFYPDMQLRLLKALGWIILATSAISAVFFPEYGLDHRGAGADGAWVGLFTHKNSLALSVVFLLTPALYVNVHGVIQRLERYAYIAASLFVVWMTQSRTGWIVAISLMGYYAAEVLLSKFARREQAILVMVLTATSIGIGVAIFQFGGVLVALLGKDLTLTGRTGIWKAVIGSVLKHPILGYGYRAFWNGLSGESANISLNDHWIVPHAHNGFLDEWLELGAVGLGLTVSCIFRTIAASVKGSTASGNGRYGAWCMCVMILTIISNISECTLMRPNNICWELFMLACIGVQSAKRFAGEPAAEPERFAFSFATQNV